MLALLISPLVALYILGPDLVSRWILGFVVPSKFRVPNKSEELTRAVLWSVGPFFLSYWICRKFGVIPPLGGIETIEKLFSGLYSEDIFKMDRAGFFFAMHDFLRMNRSLLAVMYSFVVAGSIVLDFLIIRYGVWRHRLRNWPRMRAVLATLVLPRVSEWHVLLSGMLLSDRKAQVWVDILTKGDALYKGRLNDRMLAHDGSLVNITIEGVERFKRQQYLDAREIDPTVKRADFWRRVEGRVFVVMAAEISSINIRHTYASVEPWGELEDMNNALSRLCEKIKAARDASAHETSGHH